MKRYVVTAPFVTVPAGAVLSDLSDEQISRRASRLKETKDGHEVLETVQFKRGEVITLNDEVKSLVNSLALAEDDGEGEAEDEPTEEAAPKTRSKARTRSHRGSKRSRRKKAS